MFLTQSWVEAEIVRGRLEAEGIPVDLKGDRDAPYPVGPAEVFVPSNAEAQARGIIEQIQSGSYAVQDEDAGRIFPEGEQTE